MSLRRSLVPILAAVLLPALAHANPPGREAFARGQAAAAAGDDAAARAAWEEAASSSRGWLLPRLELAELAVRRRENAEAERAALLAAAGQRSDVPRVHRLLAELSELAGDDAGALAAWSRLIELLPHEPAYRERRAAVFFRLERWNEAAGDWDRAARAQPHEPHLQMQLADALEAAGRHAEARVALERAIQLQPGREAPVRRLARFLERRGQAKEAAELHARADRLRSSPQRPERNLRPLLPSKR